MDYLKKLPAELEKLLGSDAWKFVDSLNQAFLALREEVISMSSAHSENRLSTEISRLRQEIAETRADMGELRTELKADMAALRDEVRADIQELRVRIGKLEDGMDDLKNDFREVRVEFAELRGDFAGLRGEFAELRAEQSSMESRLVARIAELRAEMKSDIQLLHKEISGLHGAITVQTRWILAAMLAASVLFPVVSQIVSFSAQLFASTVR
jgi:chromosome segregation ATPase